MNKDYYKILGVSKTATDTEIKAAYRKLAMQHHPDKNQGNLEAEKKFKDLGTAYEVLKDPQKRSMYDRGVDPNAGGFGGGFNSGFNAGGFGGFDDMFGDIFGDIFGGGRRNTSPKKGQDLQYNMSISLEEAFSGISRDININALVQCEVCDGSGANGVPDYAICTQCSGQGRIRKRNGIFTMEEVCPKCYGVGKTIKNPCKRCSGQGRYKKSKTLSVKIPAGISSGMRIRLASEGEAGAIGIQNGDLYIAVSVFRHKQFLRNENDLYLEMAIPMYVAALGDKVVLKTIDAKEIEVSIPSGINSGQRLRIKGKGMPILNRNGKMGDLYIDIAVETPTKLSKEQVKALETLFALDKKSKFTIKNH